MFRMTLTYTLMFAIVLTLINLWLSFRTGQVRIGSKVLMGDGGNPLLQARRRAHANFVEYVPLTLLLFGLIEMRVGPSQLLFGIGLVLVVARLLHPLGMDRPAPNASRAAGFALTVAVIVALVGWGAMLLYGLA